MCALPYTAQADEFNTKAFNVEIDCKNEIKFMEFKQDESFSWDNAYLLSQMALLPHSPKAEIKKAMTKWDFPDYHVIERKGINPRAIIASKDDYLVVSFRGTDNLRETLADFVIITAETKNSAFEGKVHKGFWKLYNNIRAELLAKVKLYAQGDKKIYVSGHSMGAAMAIFTAHELNHLGYNIAGLYEFASPRVGNTVLSEFFRAQDFPKFNIAEPNDIVPQIPPTTNTLENFLRLMEHINPALKPVAEEVITKTNYGYHSTENYFLITAEGFEEYDHSEQISREQNYWSTLENELLNTPKKLWVKRIEARTKSHAADNYVCLLRNQ